VHRLGVDERASPFGDTYELDQAKVISPKARIELRQVFAHKLRAHADHVLYAFNPAEIQRPLEKLRHLVAPTSTAPKNFWQVVDPTRVKESNTQTGLLLSLIPTRRYHTFVEHTFSRPLDWSGVDHIYLSLRNSGPAMSYRFVVDFRHSHRHSASFLFKARGGRWSTQVFAPAGLASAHPEEWSHVTSIRIATDDRSSAAVLGLGRVRVSMSRSREVRLALVPVTKKRTAIVGGREFVPPHAHVIVFRASPRFLVSNARVLVLPAKTGNAVQVPSVSYQQTGAAAYRFTVRSRRPGVLVLNQAYDPRWRLKFNGGYASPISAFSLVNGYLLPAGAFSGSVQFNGNSTAELGAAISGGSFLALAALGFATSRKRRWWQR
jgi:predicted outer membrane repeat protein